ncbi:guanitoxin biosynthesis MATE family efflux transporter GntT [Moorena producens]|nr:guanitoxin biosynthesis MATE family efflux transporter GntT [Moorena producens]
MTFTCSNQDNVLYRFWKLAIINILSNLTVPLAGLISVAFLGHLDQIRHLAGVVIATILFNFIYKSLGFLRMGTTGVTAQAVGRNDRDAMLLVGLRNGLIALILGVLILSLHYPLRELGFALLSATPDVKFSGIAYFNARIWGAPATLLNFVLIGWFLGREMSGKVLLLSIIGNTANIVCDYFTIIRWGWESAGAGVSVAVSQYVIVVVGLVLVTREIQWQEVISVARRIWNLSEIIATFTLNSNLFIRTLAIIFTLSIFTNMSSALGTTILAENALILEVFMLAVYFIDGLAFATETLTGNLQGQGAKEQLIPLLKIVGGSSLLLGLNLAFLFILFPQTLFGLLTNHTEVIESITIYVPWLLLVLGFGSIAFMLDGYFLGLAAGQTLRNSTVIALVVGFAPMAVASWQFQSVHLLWLALSLFMAGRAIVLGVNLPSTLK